MLIIISVQFIASMICVLLDYQKYGAEILITHAVVFIAGANAGIFLRDK